MAWYSGKRATVVFTDNDNNQVCVYHQTPVVTWGKGKITLRSGGFETVTTKRRMNEVAEHYRLGFYVYQEDFKWYVNRPNGGIVPFTDGISFPMKGFTDDLAD